MEKLRVGIIFGGMSSEKEVSLNSGRNVYDNMDREQFEPVPVFMEPGGQLWVLPWQLISQNTTTDISERLATEAERIAYEDLKGRIEFAFIALHGKYGDDGCIQGLLELLNIPYTGPGILASAIGMDKYVSRRILAISGIDVPRTVPVPRRRWDAGREALIGTIVREIGFPCVVKPNREGCSTAVKKVVAVEGLAGALEDAFGWDNLCLVEEFLSGMEVTCGVLGGGAPEALTPSETIPTDGLLSLEDKFLYGQGENKTPARLPAEQLEKIRETAVKTFLALNLKGYARIDMFVRSDGRVAVLEPNTLPGLTPSTVLFHQAAASGITQGGIIDRIIRSALEVHAHKRGPL